MFLKIFSVFLFLRGSGNRFFEPRVENLKLLVGRLSLMLRFSCKLTFLVFKYLCCNLKRFNDCEVVIV